VYGRIAASQVSICSNGAVFYDHSLDSGAGYTNPGSKLYDDDGRIRAEVNALPSLNDSDLTNLSDVLEAPVSAVGRLIGAGALALGGGAKVQGDQAASTPRTVPVEFGMVSVGNNVFAMETAVTSGGWASVEDEVKSDFDTLPSNKNTIVANAANEAEVQ
jgi:hypothetical protein